MLRELYALLHRYYTVYLRLPKRLLSDFLLAAIIAGALALCRLQDIGYLAVVVYVITLPFTFITTVRTMLGEIVSEKGSGIKEYLKLNGLSIYVYQLYLTIVTSIKTAFCTAFIVVGILLGALITSVQSNPLFDLGISTGDTILTYILCAFGTISFILFLSTFFSDAKVAASVGSLVYAAISLCSNIVFASTNSTYYYLICLFPQSALTITLFSGLIGDDSYVPGFTYNGARLIMVFDIFIYLILYVYLDQVLKDENGVQRSPLFFLDFLRAKKTRGVTVRQSPNDSGVHLLNNQPESAAIDIPGAVDGSSAVYHEALVGAQNLRKAVEVQHLVKNFGSFTAVDNVSFPIYEGQIFCLLGHNGAGKTTTIRMMTGLVEIDKGHILYDGADFVENMKEIRRTIGICTQQDILYEKLKVCEHLELIAKLRKIPEGDIPAAVDEAIARLNLTNERDKYSEELSGGNKRKLSLAMAVLGRTKIIFLDEPTSGMDPQNRRVMWQHLKELRKQGLTILLTTHHLDEADELADRIAIMSKGKLLALGTSEFFKKNFGVGYHLNLTPKYELINSADFQALKPTLGKAIHDIVPIAEFDNQTAPDVLKCCLPFTEQKNFPRLFAELETNEAVRISVEMNTLEDVFVNIGLKEEQLLNPNAGRSDLNLNIQPPACLSEKPIYSFTSQVYALAKRRFYILSRSGRNIFLMVLPAVLILIGVLSSLGFNDAESRIGFFEVVTVLAFALNTGAYCSLPVYEREEKLKYLMDVMGLRVLPYWIGNVIVDWIAITIINLIAFALYCWLYSGINTEYIIDSLIFVTPGQFLAVIIPHGFALVTIGYAYSFLFDRALSAVKYFPLLYFFILFLLGTFAVAKLQNNGKAGDFMLFFAAVVGVICPSSIFLEFLGGNQMMTGLSVGETVIAELFYALVYFAITVFLSSRSLRFKPGTARQGYAAQENQPIPIDFNDINFERNRTAQAAQDPIKVMGLTKVYDNGYTAVRETSFGVEPGQIFGLLGPNGAGKSTTFNILTAAIPKSEGSVKLLNHEVDRNMPEVFENVGICPQFNGLWDHLTVREHLILFGNLKGLSGPKLDQVTEYYLDALHLRDHENKRAHALSGGNKRKLSVANAFIGSAYLLFLDEPSSGVDPLARRFLWNSIQQVLKMRQASVVLTTHSMYEAESLSHKIGILINGRFVCVGPTQYLKDKYSQGYKITVSLLPDCPDPMPKVQELFPNAVRIFDASYVQQTYHLPSQDFKFSSAFEKLDVLKHDGVVKDFSIYNTTLEQIFIYFSRFQINLENNQ